MTRRKDGSWLHSLVYMADIICTLMLTWARCGNWTERGISEYHHGVAVRCEARVLQDGVLPK